MSTSNTKINKMTKKIWDILMVYFRNDYVVAGLMGHMYVLSELKPGLIKGYNEAVGNLSMEEFVHGQGTYGIRQWSKWTSKQGLWNIARFEKKPIGSLDVQLEFIWDELKELEYVEMMKKLKRCKSIYNVVKLLADGYFYKGRVVRKSKVEQAYEHAIDIFSAYSDKEKANEEHNKIKRIRNNVATGWSKKVLVTDCSTIRVHSADNGKSKTVGFLNAGSKYEFVASNDNQKWHCIVYDGKLRWVYRNNTQVIDK